MAGGARGRHRHRPRRRWRWRRRTRRGTGSAARARVPAGATGPTGSTGASTSWSRTRPISRRPRSTALAPDVRDWEPRHALTPGPTGLEAYAADRGRAARRCWRRAGGRCFEIGPAQGAAVAALLRAARASRESPSIRDLDGRDRVVERARTEPSPTPVFALVIRARDAYMLVMILPRSSEFFDVTQGGSDTCTDTSGRRMAAARRPGDPRPHSHTMAETSRHETIEQVSVPGTSLGTTATSTTTTSAATAWATSSTASSRARGPMARCAARRSRSSTSTRRWRATRSWPATGWRRRATCSIPSTTAGSSARPSASSRRTALQPGARGGRRGGEDGGQRDDGGQRVDDGFDSRSAGSRRWPARWPRADDDRSRTTPSTSPGRSRRPRAGAQGRSRRPRAAAPLPTRLRAAAARPPRRRRR